MSVTTIRRLTYSLSKTVSKRHYSCQKNVGNIVKSTAQDLQIPDLTLPQFIFQNDEWSNKFAIECGVTGKKYTFKEIRTQSRNLANSLIRKLKLSKGDVVAILLPNVPEYPICLLGPLEVGLVVAPINSFYTVDEITRHLHLTRTKAIITLTSLVSVVNQCNVQVPVIAIKFNVTDAIPEKAINFSELVEDGIQDTVSLQRNANDIAVLPSSGGTTGFPKAVELTHRNLVANVLQLCHPYFAFVADTTANHQDVMPAVLPFFHIYGITVIQLVSLYKRSKLISLPKFQPDLYTKVLVEHKPQVLYVVPHIVGFLSNNSNVKKEHFESVGIIFSGAAPLALSDEERLRRKIGKPVDFVEGYGMTESSPGICVSSNKRKKEVRSRKSVGEALPNTSMKVVAIDDSSNTGLGPNQQGEILLKGPQVMKGYYNQPKETKAAIIDGWLKTGDVGYYDDDHQFYISDRLKELIKVKGFQVVPAELEAILRDHPHVLEATVIGVPHKVYGEVPRAYLVLKENTKLDQEEVNKFIEEKVADYKKIRGGVAIVNSLPKSPAGKILRKELKKEYESKVGVQAAH